ncbi:MAG: hypothetical protein D6679_14070 [Candidatus Hydrogenedentota bacterium]|nr:MAG: hypothetical protein D6679_14070 [Candidatus Hydrogenedentota bacterium]
MWGILVGKTLGATYASRTGDTSEERKAKIYGLIWLLLGFLVVLTVVFKANFVARKGDLGLKREVERNVFRKRDG